MAGGYSSRSAASSKVLLVLTALPLSLALFAFVLQRRGGGGGGGLVDPAGIGQLAAGGNSRLPGVVLQLDLRSSRTGAGGGGGAITNSDCANKLLQRGGRMHQPGWKHDILNAATPKVNSPRSTKEKKTLNPLLCCVSLIAAHIRMGSFFFVFLGGSHEARRKSSVKPPRFRVPRGVLVLCWIRILLISIWCGKRERGGNADLNNYKHISRARADSTMALLPSGHWGHQFLPLC